jgi:hypothetical protein
VTDSVTSAGLAGNVVGASSRRPVVVYLPPSYKRNRARRYPLLYMLHGATSVPEEWLDGTTYQGLDLRVALDSLIAARAIPELILAIPNSDIALGSQWYANSPVLGNWEDFIVRDVVGFVDRHYRTVARREGRALFGHSMGGFGVLAIGFKHPGRFGFVYASSPSRIAFTGTIAPGAVTWDSLARLERWQDGSYDLRLAIGLAAAFDGSPGRDSPAPRPARQPRRPVRGYDLRGRAHRSGTRADHAAHAAGPRAMAPRGGLGAAPAVPVKIRGIRSVADGRQFSVAAAGS